mmetsp:Transcript_78213/g.142266  ORF Transcript_78213/g.142266 Transcript_78213/m.142266 type:complete len:385 (+) Transcript_78213:1-1155(+)
MAQAQLKLWEPVVSLASLLNSPSSCCQVMARRLSLSLAIFFLSVLAPCLTTRGDQKEECAADETQVAVTRHGQQAMLSPSSGDAATTEKTFGSLWLIRHGLKEGGEQAKPADGLDWKWSLSEAGKAQAEDAGKYFEETFRNNLQITKDNANKTVELFVSPFLRTVQTAAPIARELGIKAHLELGLGEARKPLPPVDYHSGGPALNYIQSLQNEDSNLQDFFHEKQKALVIPVNGETNPDYIQRATDMASALNNLQAIRAGKHVIVVSHGSVVTLLIAALTKDPLAGIGGADKEQSVQHGHLHEATVFELQKSAEGTPWIVVRNGESPWEKISQPSFTWTSEALSQSSPYPCDRGSWKNFANLDKRPWVRNQGNVNPLTDPDSWP